MGGQYYVDVGIYQGSWEYAYDYHWHAYPLSIYPASAEKGILRPPHHWEIIDVNRTSPGSEELSSLKKTL
jgi:lipopolysaccharide transport system ATP-binding protein